MTEINMTKMKQNVKMQIFYTMSS